MPGVPATSDNAHIIIEMMMIIKCRLHVNFLVSSIVWQNYIDIYFYTTVAKKQYYLDIYASDI